MSTQLSRLGLSVRFPLVDIEDYRLIGKRLHGLTASKVVQAMAAELVASVYSARAEEIDLTSSWLIRGLFQNDELRAICTRIFDRGERELPNSLTQSIWIGFTPDQVEILSQVTKVLQWPLGKLVQRAVWDALTIVADESGENKANKKAHEEAIPGVPVIATFYWGITYAERAVKPTLKKYLDEALKKWEETKPRTNDRTPDHVGQPIQDDVGITRDEV